MPVCFIFSLNCHSSPELLCQTFFVECALARETHGATLMERNGKQESQLCCSLCLVSTEDANKL